MNKPIYLGESILDISKTFGDKIKLCYTDTNSFVIEVKTEDIYVDISDDVKK